MLLRWFSGNKALNAILIFLFVGLSWAPSLAVKETQAFFHIEEPMLFYRWASVFFHENVIASKLFAFAFILFQAMVLIRLNVRFIFLQERTFLPAFFFLIIVSFYYPDLQFSKYIFGSMSFLILLEMIFSTYKTEGSSLRYFDAGLILGIGSLFYARMIYFLPFIWISQIILRPPSWREWVYPVAGAVLPAAIISTLNYLTGGDPAALFKTGYDQLNNFYFAFRFNHAYLILSSYLLLLVVIASLYMLRVYQFRKIYIRNYYLVFFWLFVISVILFSFFTRFDPGILYIAAIPVSYLLSNYFIHSRKSPGNRLLFGLLLLLFLANGLNHWFGWI